jgi:hypothetical protein
LRERALPTSSNGRSRKLENYTLTAAVPRDQSACHALVGLLTPEFTAKQAFSSTVADNGVNQNASRIVPGYSGGAVLDLHQVPCFVGRLENQSADHQRTS